jgi:hypothetical protein
MAKPKFSAVFALALLLPLAPVRAAEDDGVARLALCQDSWLDWQSKEPARLKAFGEHFRAAFVPKSNDGSAVPRTETSILGMRILRVYPESVGMGVGFSVIVDATFATARKALEHSIGKPLVKCETGDSMTTCGLEIAEKRTLTVMASDDPKTSETLIGCYYFYEK